MRVRRAAAIAVAAALALAASGCSAGAGKSGSDEDKQEITVAQTAEPANLDFTSTSGAAIGQALMENVYQSLVRVGDDGRLEPALAKSWEVSADRRTYTFALQDGATFSNGHPVTAQDVKSSYDRVAKWKNPLKAKMADVDSVTAKDERTVVIALHRPSNRWLFDLASIVGAVFDDRAHDDLANTAVGSGPFTIEKYARGQEIDFAARDDYWGDKPHARKVVFRYFKDSVAAANALKSGDVDVLGNLQAPELFKDFESDTSAYQVIEGTSNGEVVLSMNNAQGIFKDKRAREAVMYAVDRKAVLDTAWGGHGTLIGGMVPPTDPYYEDLTGVWPHDAAKAKRLVEEAGLSGKEFAFTVPNLPYATAIANIVTSQLADAGLKAKVETQEFPAVWLDKTFTKHAYDMSVVNHVEARDILTVFGKGYYTGYDSARIDAQAKAADEGTEAQYAAGMKKVARTITEDAAADFLFLFPNLVVAKAGVTGIQRNQVSDAFPIAGLGWS
ncbi:ABC transporter substrate-binding protein [Brevibacterium sp. 5221]|uniref:ABC transporter substrate-binding protein n=1 Tax=Brevibacterium rongguiense TaxID=2695267 RepID=A0A6N9H999_9MICO|nr:ABC transporter substrate-binding protein [Brevibacterium rongguiense]MYM20617.1 ABC transporter substrate-binding protein [Brevibacterium rongguiense]